MIDKVFHTVDVAGKAAHAVVDSHDIGLKLMD